jgi:transposase
VANQLREHLNRVFPGAVGLFTKLDSPISLRFLARFDCQDRADWLTPRRLELWLKSMGYCGRTDPAAVDTDAGAAQVPITRALVAALRSLVEQITMLSDQIGQQLEARADSHIFSPACLMPEQCVQQGYWPKLVTAALDSPRQSHWRARRA